MKPQQLEHEPETGPVPRRESPALQRPSRPGRRLVRGLVFGLGLLALPLSGCAGDGGVPIACAGDVYCPPPTNNIPWAVQLWPSTSGDSTQLLPKEETKLFFDVSGTAKLQIRLPAQVRGTISDSLQKPVARARVVALLSSTIPGQQAYSFDTLTADQPVGQWALRVPVPPMPVEQPYRFWVGFDDTAQAALYPPRRLDQAVTSDSELSIRMRPVTELAVVKGRVIDPLGEGVSGMTVQVLDSTNQIVSSTAVTTGGTGTSAGVYRVLVDPSLPTIASGDLKVTVRPGPQNPNMPSLEAAMLVPKVGSETSVEFTMPSFLKPITFTLPIRGVSTSGTNQPVVSARVQAQVLLDDAMTRPGQHAIYTATAEADATGLAKLPLIPATTGGPNLLYKVTVSSPSRSLFSSLRDIEVKVGPKDGTLTAVTLPLRAQFRGRLVDSDGKPVAGATVAASDISHDGSVNVQPFSPMVSSTTPQTTTDSDGSFALPLDPGDYDLDFIPVPGTAPRTSLDNQRILSSDLALGEVVLPRLSLGKVLVVGQNGSPLAKVKVRVFQLPDTTPKFGLACTQDLPCSRTARLRAEAFTDDKGLAQFLLPDSIPLATLQPPRLISGLPE